MPLRTMHAGGLASLTIGVSVNACAWSHMIDWRPIQGLLLPHAQD